MGGRVPIDEVFYADFITSRFDTGAVTDADSTPTFEVFEEATDTDIGVGGNATKRTSKTGNYRLSFTCSAANGFEAGKFYSVVASATVNSVAGKGVVAHFQVVPAESVVGTPKVDVAAWLGTAAATPTVAGVPEVDLTHVAGSTTSVSALASGVATLLADWINGGRLDLILDIIAADTTTDIPALIAALQAFVDTEVAAILAAVDTEVAAILADTNELQVDLVNGGRLDLLIDAIKAKTDGLPSDPADASVIAGRFDTLDTAVADLPTNAELVASQAAADDATLAAIAALNNLSAAQVNAEVDTALADYDPPTKAELDAAVAPLATTAGIPSAATIAAAVWASTIESGFTALQLARLWTAALVGKLSGAATVTNTIRDINDTKDRIVATVDADGNRTAVTKDVT